MKKIHLTFDDGPHVTNTLSVLDILRERGIIATFFVLGERLASQGKILERAVAEGHRVGNHTFDHKDLTTLTDEEITSEIKRTEELIARHVTVDYILRPPYGARNSRINNIIQSLGYNTVMWTVDTEDWKRKPDGWVEYGLQQIRKREESLVLMHDIHATTAANLPTFIDQIAATGATFVDLESITGFPPPDSNGDKPQPAPRYHTVLKGETLSSISRKYYGTPNHWQLIYKANTSIISNPDVITPGQRLLIPYI